MKQLLLSLIILMAPCAVLADILFWQIDQTGIDKPVEFAFAKIVDTQTKTGLSLYDSEGNLLTVSAVAANNAAAMTDLGTATDGLYAQLGDSPEGLYFQVLLYGTTGNLVGQSNEASYDLLAPYIFRSVDDLSAGRPWMPSVMVASPSEPLPEPTEGLLILLGGAVLALRRKQRNADAKHV